MRISRGAPRSSLPCVSSARLSNIVGLVCSQGYGDHCLCVCPPIGAVGFSLFGSIAYLCIAMFLCFFVCVFLFHQPSGFLSSVFRDFPASAMVLALHGVSLSCPVSAGRCATSPMAILLLPAFPLNVYVTMIRDAGDVASRQQRGTSPVLVRPWLEKNHRAPPRQERTPPFENSRLVMERCCSTILPTF